MEKVNLALQGAHLEALQHNRACREIKAFASGYEVKKVMKIMHMAKN